MAEAAFRTEAVRRQVDALGRLLQDRNRLLASRSRQVEAIFNSQGPEAFVAVLQQALATSVYPHGMQGSWAAVYRPEVRELLIEPARQDPDYRRRGAEIHAQGIFGDRRADQSSEAAA